MPPTAKNPATKAGAKGDWEMDKADMGRRLLRLRVARGKMEVPPIQFTQTAFAKRAGLSQGAYANYEIGARQPEIAALAQIKDVYGVTLDWLLLGDDSALPFGIIDKLASVTQAELQAAQKKKR